MAASPAGPGAPDSAPPDNGWWAPRFVGSSLALLLSMRGLYLLRFGWDPGWMNVNYLLRAKLFALHQLAPAEEPPLTPLLLWAARSLGLSGTGAMSAIYLGAHLLWFFGVLGLGAFVWPAASLRRRAAVTITAVLVPLQSTGSGYCNLAVLVGAGLAVAAVALAAAAASSARRSPILLGLAAVATLLAGATRLESLLTCAAAAGVLLFGRRIRDLAHPRSAALVMGAACVAAFLINSHFSGERQADYAYYTFYDGLPYLMYPRFSASEYERYRASMAYFGSYASNGGSLARALFSHPLAALERIVTKTLDVVGVLFRFDCLTPIAMAGVISGARGLRRSKDGTWDRAWLLLAFLPPLAILFVPCSKPHYYLSIAAPLVLIASRGFDRWTVNLSPKAARILAAVIVVVMAGVVGWAGNWSPSNSRTNNLAAGYLEQRCSTGCLTNVLPQALDRQAWVELQAGAPIIRAHHRSEDSIVGDYVKSHAHDYNFCARVHRARAAGFNGPLLWVDVRIHSYQPFDTNFDSEVRYQGQVDLSGVTIEQRFSDGPDELDVYRLPDDWSCVE